MNCKNPKVISDKILGKIFIQLELRIARKIFLSSLKFKFRVFYVQKTEISSFARIPFANHLIFVDSLTILITKTTNCNQNYNSK